MANPSEVLDPSAPLQIIRRRYGRIITVPGGVNPALALQSYNSSPLHDGALGIVYAGDSGTGQAGFGRIFVFRRAYTIPQADETEISFSPVAGGGAWVEMAGANMNVNWNPMTGTNEALTAGAGPVVLGQVSDVIYPGTLMSALVTGSVLLSTGAVAGSQVQVKLQLGTGNPMVWSDKDSVTVVMLANQYLSVNLSHRFTVNYSAPIWGWRLTAEAAVQSAVAVKTIGCAHQVYESYR